MKGFPRKKCASTKRYWKGQFIGFRDVMGRKIRIGDSIIGMSHGHSGFIIGVVGVDRNPHGEIEPDIATKNLSYVNEADYVGFEWCNSFVLNGLQLSEIK